MYSPRKLTILTANRNQNGRELLPSADASMIALDTRGPMNEDVLPTMLNSEKNRNSFPLGVTSDIYGMISKLQFHQRRRGYRPSSWKS